MASIKARLYNLLRWSEQYTKIDMVFAFSTGWWSVVAQVASSIGALILALIIARVVAKSEYGEYQYVLSIVSILSIFSLSGLGSALLQSVARGFDQSLWDAFWLNLRWSFGIVLGAVIIGAYYFYHGNVALGATILIAGVASPLIASFNLHGWFLNGKKDAKRSSLYPNGIGNVVPIIGIITGALLLHNAMGLILGYVLANLFTTGFLLWRTIRVYPLNNRHDSGLKRYSFHLSLVKVLSTISNNLGNLMLFHFAGAADVAVYNFAVSIPDQTNGPISTIGTMMTARYASHAPRAIQEGMRNKMFWLFAMNAAIVVAYALVAPLIYHILFPAYGDAIDYSRLYIVGLLSNMFIPAGAFLAAHKCVQEQYVNSISVSVLQIVTMIGGVLIWGVWGLIAARVVSKLTNGIIVQLLYIRARKRLKDSPTIIASQ